MLANMAEEALKKNDALNCMNDLDIKISFVRSWNEYVSAIIDINFLKVRSLK